MSLEIDLSGKVAVVTGGGRGIGAAIGASYAAAGAKVILVSRSLGELRRTGAEIRACGGKCDTLQCDLSADDPGWVIRQTLARHGRVDAVVHAAGNQVRRPSTEMSVEDWDDLMNLHARCAFLLAKEAVQSMVATGQGGSLIFIGSLTSERLGHPGTITYNAAKAAVVSLARTFAVEFGSTGVRANAIVPGFIMTDMVRLVAASPERRRLIDRVPLGRYGEASEIGSIAAFLASDLASYITGGVITIDGGWSAA